MKLYYADYQKTRSSMDLLIVQYLDEFCVISSFSRKPKKYKKSNCINLRNYEFCEVFAFTWNCFTKNETTL